MDDMDQEDVELIERSMAHFHAALAVAEYAATIATDRDERDGILRWVLHQRGGAAES